MNAPVHKTGSVFNLNFALSTLAAIATLALTTTTNARAQSRASIATITKEGRQNPPETVLLECGAAHYKATLQWTGENQKVLVRFENRSAQAVCGNSVYSADILAATTTTGSDKTSRLSFKSIDSYDNANLNVSALFNPGLRQVVRKGRTDLFACKGQVGQAEPLDIQEAGLVSLKYRDAKMESVCGQGRYVSIAKLIQEKVQISKHPVQPIKATYSQNGYMECGTAYYAVRLDHEDASSYPTAHFENQNAEAVCGNTKYLDREISATRGAVGTTIARFVVKSNRPSLLDSKIYQRGQQLDKVVCKNNLGAAQVADTANGYGLVSFKFANPQLEALCGQGRYYFAEWSLFNYTINVEKILNATRSLAERQAMGQVNYLTH